MLVHLLQPFTRWVNDVGAFSRYGDLQAAAGGGTAGKQGNLHKDRPGAMVPDFPRVTSFGSLEAP